MVAGNSRSVRVTGLREVLRVTDELPRETKKAVRDEIRKAVEPVRDEAQREMTAWLVKHKASPKKTRFGISVRRAGLVSVEQRVRSKGGRKKQTFVDKQLDDFLIPAGNHNTASVDRAMDDVLRRLQRKWVTG